MGPEPRACLFAVRLGALCLALALATPAMAQRYTAEIVSYSTDTFLVSTWTPLTLRVKNTGIANTFRVSASSMPPGWSIQPEVVADYVAAGSTKSFAFQVQSVSSQPTGAIEWRVVQNTLEGYPVIAAEDEQAVEAVFPPGAFGLVSPPPEETAVETAPSFRWGSAHGAASYRVELFHDTDGEAEPDPFFESSPVAITQWSLAADDRLSYDSPYWWQVVARNEYAETRNREGKVLFHTKALPPLGTFTILSPVANHRYGTLPLVSWSASSNAIYYEIKVYADANGVPASTPLDFGRYVDRTYWTWENFPIAKGARYWVEVAAYGESAFMGRKKAINSPVPFTYSSIEPFALRSPLLGQTTGLRPTFEWDAATGAQKYRVELRGAGVVNSGFRHIAETTNRQYVYPDVELTPNAPYEWSVFAVRTDEEMAAWPEVAPFRTVDLRPFLLLEPRHNEFGIEPRPRFTWQPVRGTAVDTLLLEVWRDHDSLPGEKTRVYVSHPAMPPFTTSHDYNGVTLERGRRYYWRVLAYSPRGHSRVNVGEFRPFWLTTLTDFSLLAPTDLSTNVAVQPTFRWQSSPTAEFYSLYVWRTDDSGQLQGSPVSVVHNITDTEYYYVDSPLLLGHGRYAWTVVARQSEAQTRGLGPKQGPWRFTTGSQQNWFGVGVKEAILGQGVLRGEAADNADAQNGDGFLDVADIVAWRKYSP